MDEEHERQAENLANQMAINKQQGTQIQRLQKKIDSFSNNQSSVSQPFLSITFKFLQLVEKSRFKASSYMEQINQREEELGRVRQNLVNAQEENKQLTVTREKFRQQNEFLSNDLKEMENEFAVQKRKIEEQQRLIDSLCVTQKVQNHSLSGAGNHDAMMQKAAEESQRNERIAMGTNRSTFLNLGEKQTKLVSESESSLLKRQKIKGPGAASGRSSNTHQPSPYMTETQRKD